MIRLAVLLTLAPLAVADHPSDLPHMHTQDPSLLMGLGMLAVFFCVGLIMKGRRG